ncbi:MAG TPA: Hpt domain-containing protein [Chakrabartia sp.]|jgi:HPt (histidine-containing phosphotransfer) domain-containing protein|nr:Hpt domain-containing protein [Chakrabartia sp.]
MAFPFDSFDQSILVSLGDDPLLMAELTQALAENARLHADLMERARCDANWHGAAERLAGLAASFGAKRLLSAAHLALESAPGDPVALRSVRQAIAALG